MNTTICHLWKVEWRRMAEAANASKWNRNNNPSTRIDFSFKSSGSSNLPSSSALILRRIRSRSFRFQARVIGIWMSQSHNKNQTDLPKWQFGAYKSMFNAATFNILPRPNNPSDVMNIRVLLISPAGKSSEFLSKSSFHPWLWTDLKN